MLVMAPARQARVLIIRACCFMISRRIKDQPDGSRRQGPVNSRNSINKLMARPCVRVTAQDTTVVYIGGIWKDTFAIPRDRFRDTISAPIPGFRATDIASLLMIQRSGQTE